MANIYVITTWYSIIKLPGNQPLHGSELVANSWFFFFDMYAFSTLDPNTRTMQNFVNASGKFRADQCALQRVITRLWPYHGERIIQNILLSYPQSVTLHGYYHVGLRYVRVYISRSCFQPRCYVHINEEMEYIYATVNNMKSCKNMLNNITALKHKTHLNKC